MTVKNKIIFLLLLPLTILIQITPSLSQNLINANYLSETTPCVVGNVEGYCQIRSNFGNSNYSNTHVQEQTSYPQFSNYTNQTMPTLAQQSTGTIQGAASVPNAAEVTMRSDMLAAFQRQAPVSKALNLKPSGYVRASAGLLMNKFDDIQSEDNKDESTSKKEKSKSIGLTAGIMLNRYFGFEGRVGMSLDKSSSKTTVEEPIKEEEEAEEEGEAKEEEGEEHRIVKAMVAAYSKPQPKSNPKDIPKPTGIPETEESEETAENSNYRTEGYIAALARIQAPIDSNNLRIIPYANVGIAAVKTSFDKTIGTSITEEAETKVGFAAAVGLEVALNSGLVLGIDASYLPNNVKTVAATVGYNF